VRPGRRRAWNTVFAIRRAAAPASTAIDQLLAALRG
jgi:hypothetical protein